MASDARGRTSRASLQRSIEAKPGIERNSEIGSEHNLSVHCKLAKRQLDLQMRVAGDGIAVSDPEDVGLEWCRQRYAGTQCHADFILPFRSQD